MRLNEDKKRELDLKISQMRKNKDKIEDIAKDVGMSISYVVKRIALIDANKKGLNDVPKKYSNNSLSDEEKRIRSNIKKYRVSKKRIKESMITCVVCCKVFFVDIPPEYAYSRSTGCHKFYCCSHKCFRIADEAYENSLSRNVRWQKVDMNDYEE